MVVAGLAGLGDNNFTIVMHLLSFDELVFEILCVLNTVTMQSVSSLQHPVAVGAP